MLLVIDGSFSDSSLYKPKLCSVEIRSQVYSKQQARDEFERFLNSVDLPEMARGDVASAERGL